MIDLEAFVTLCLAVFGGSTYQVACILYISMVNYTDPFYRLLFKAGIVDQALKFAAFG